MGKNAFDSPAQRLLARWYDADRPPPVALRPLAALYGLALEFRDRLARPPAKVGKPVIALGNLSVGGTGKTPLAIFLARALLARGLKPAILSRGHGRKRGGPKTLAVCDGAGPLVPPEIAGDEPWLMAREVPRALVLVDADRARAARLAINNFGADVFILDDGLSQLSLAMDLRVLLVPARNPFGNKALIPAGPLRLPLEDHRRADFIVSTGGPAPGPEAAALAEGRPRWAAAYRPRGLRPLNGGALQAPAALAGRNFFAFCGLGRPQNFRDSLMDAGLGLAGFRDWADHQVYGPAQMAELAASLESSGADYLVTTAKDAVKLGAAPAALAERTMVLEVELSLDRPEEFIAAVLGAVHAR